MSFYAVCFLNVSRVIAAVSSKFEAINPNDYYSAASNCGVTQQSCDTSFKHTEVLCESSGGDSRAVSTFFNSNLNDGLTSCLRDRLLSQCGDSLLSNNDFLVVEGLAIAFSVLLLMTCYCYRNCIKTTFLPCFFKAPERDGYAVIPGNDVAPRGDAGSVINSI